MRIKFLRILPEMCASTRCLFSSSTRNMALGSGSMTVAITSMASSLGLPSVFGLSGCSGLLLYMFLITLLLQIANAARQLPTRPLHFARARENPRTVAGDRHSVLEVRGITAVSGDRRPLVLQHPYLRGARIHHGLNGQDHAFPQTGS